MTNASPAPDRPLALVIDDNDALRNVVQRALEVVKIPTVGSRSAREGLAMLAANPVPLVLTDISMPEMNGWEFCLQARSLYPDLMLGIMTGWGATEQAQLDAHGVSFVVLKPFNIRELQTQVLMIFRERGLISDA